MAGHRSAKRVPPPRRDQVRQHRMAEAYAQAQTPEERLAVAYDWFRSAMRRAGRRRTPDIGQIGAARATAQQCADALMQAIHELGKG